MYRSRLSHWRRLAYSAVLFSAIPAVAAGPSQQMPELPTQIPSTKPLRLARSPKLESQSLKSTAGEEPEVRPLDEEGAAIGEQCGPCKGAPCVPYLRNRPEGCQRDRIKMYNRMSEPNWYKYYRCCHYGYHPTQWAAWPDGWLTCRNPQPGPHPYDRHAPKPDQRTLDRERRNLELDNDPLRRNTPPDLLDEPLPGEAPGVLPPANTTPTPQLPPSGIDTPMPLQQP